MNDSKYIKVGVLKGMSNDLAYSKYPEGSYLDAKNMNIYINKPGGTFVLENIDGHKKDVTMTLPSSPLILEVIEAIDSLLLFFTYKNSSNDPLFCIYRINKSVFENYTDLEIDPTAWYHNTKTLGTVYKEDITDRTFSLTLAKYNYENDTVQKVYWVDDTGFRHINIDNNVLNELEDLEADSTYAFTKDLNLSQPEFVNFTSGSLMNGAYFYTYQLYNVRGVESYFCPLSKVVYLTNMFSTTDYKKISAGNIGDNSNRGVYGKIEGIDVTKYSRIRILSVYYSSKDATPTINIISEKPVSSTVYFIDSGNYIGVLSETELKFRNAFINPSILEDKQGYLFAAGLTNFDYFDVDEWILENDSSNSGFVTDINGEQFWESRAFSFGYDSTEASSAKYKCAIYSVGEIPIRHGIIPPGTSYAYPPAEIFLSMNTTDRDIIGNTTNDNILNLSPYPIPKNFDCIYPAIVNLKHTTNDGLGRVSATTAKDCTYGLNPHSVRLDDVVRYGAFGPNVSCKFAYKTININGVSDKAEFKGDIISPTKNDGFYDDNTNPTQTLSIPFDEVERYGIQFREKSTGRISYVKWIIDLRSPLPNAYAFDNPSTVNPDAQTVTDIVTTADDNSATDFTKSLFLEFSVINIPEGLEWRIVKVPKETENDYSNKSFGATSSMRVSSENMVPGVRLYSNSIDLMGGYASDNSYIIGPDIFYNEYLKNNIDSLQDIYIQTIGSFNSYTAQTNSALSAPTWRSINYMYTNLETITSNLTSNIDLDFKYIKAANFSDTLMLDTVNVPFNNDLYNNLITLEGHDSLSYLSRGGSRLLVNWKYYKELSGELGGLTVNPLMVIIKQENYNVRYGGPSYVDRSYNIYTPVSEFTATSASFVYGDYYVGMFEYLNGFLGDQGAIPDPLELGDPTSTCSNIFWIPMMSRFNFMNSQSQWRKLDDKTTAINFLLNESKGVFERSGVVYTQEEDYYFHNDVYSMNQAMLDINITKPFDYLESKNELSVKNSNYKIPGEYTDSWLKFNNTGISLSAKYGTIIDIFRFKNDLYFFQESAFGKIYSLERQSSAEKDSIVISKGNELEGFSVIEQNTGIDTKYNYTFSDNFIYWYDENRNSIFVFDGTKSIDLLEKTANYSILKDKTVIGLNYDFYNNCLLISTLESSTYEYLIYNEKLNAFTSRVDFKKVIFFKYKNNLKFVSSDSIYDINHGDKGELVGVTKDSSVTFLINPNQSSAFIAEFIEVLLEKFTTSPTTIDVGSLSNYIKAFKIENSYQSTTITTSNINKLFVKVHGKYRFNKFLNTVTTGGPGLGDEGNVGGSFETATSTTKKFIDYFIKLRITLDNTEHDRLLLHDLILNYNMTYI